jgi:hypothetical protein
MDNPQVFVWPVIMLVFFGGYMLWMKNRTQTAMAGLGPAMHAFFAKTGFRYAHIPPEPIEAHVHTAMQEANDYNVANRVIHYVRNFHGVPIHFRQAYQYSGNTYSISCSWSASLAAPVRIPFQIADRSLSSMGKAVREAFSNTTRVWNPKFPHAVTTGLPHIDQRFVVLGNDPAAVQWLLQQNPALVAALMQCVEVDLWVDGCEAVFSDPSQKNMNAAMGGTVGQMALGFDYGKRMDMSIPVHERMSEILALAARAGQ